MTRTALVTGASGLLGRAVQAQFRLDGWKVVGTGLTRINPPEVIRLDILDFKNIERVVDEVKPDVIVHCAANRFPDSCSANPSAAQRINVESSRALAEAALARNTFLIYISTDYVFAGRRGDAPYKSTAQTGPLNIYGQTKLDGERAVLEVAKKCNKPNQAVVLRIPILYGSCDEPKESAVNVLMYQLWEAQKIEPGQSKIKVEHWSIRYPTNTRDVGRVCRDVSKYYLEPSNTAKDLPSILHFTSEDAMTKWQMCQTFSEIMGLPLENMAPFTPGRGTDGGVVKPYDCHLDTHALTELGIDVTTIDFKSWWRREVGAFR